MIPIGWDGRTGTLTIGDRGGVFPGMVEHRYFHIILVRRGHGAGEDISGTADAEINYGGKEVQTAFR
ncbi:MAG: DUF5110 domain-containing protein [Acidobacteriaceae bacterium]